MKKRSMLKIMITAMFTAASLTACGGSGGAASTADAVAYETAASNSSATYDTGGGYLFGNESVAFDEEIAEAELAEEMPGEYDIEDSETGAANAQQDALADRKLIKTVNMDVETEEFDILIPALEQRVTALGGYIEDMSSYNRNNYYSDDYIGTKYLRYASMTIRIPKDNLDTFLSMVAEQSNIVGRSESVTDVTLQYVDLESHKKALVAEQDRLLELMEQAETVEDIITIEGRLSEVRYQIESMESQLRTYDNKIDYSTVYLSIDEVEQYTPTEGSTVGQRIASGFTNSLRGVGRGISNFTIWFIINIPYIIIWIIIIIIIFLIVKAACRAIARRHGKQGIPQNNPYQTQGAREPDSYALTETQPNAQNPQELQQQISAEDRKTEDNNKES